MLGWIASKPAVSTGMMRQVLPLSSDFSRCTLHLYVVSVLEGARMVIAASWTGLFLIGPNIPSGRRTGADQVLPSSTEVDNIPHHCCTVGPTLYKSINLPLLFLKSTG